MPNMTRPDAFQWFRDHGMHLWETHGDGDLFLITDGGTPAGPEGLQVRSRFLTWGEVLAVIETFEADTGRPPV
jgi:hypothetical protein